MLLRDFEGYQIGIHGDSMSKAITVQFYLPADESQAHIAKAPARGTRRRGGGAHRSTAVPARERVMLTYCVQERAVNSVVERLKRPWVFLVYAARR